MSRKIFTIIKFIPPKCECLNNENGYPTIIIAILKQIFIINLNIDSFNEKAIILCKTLRTRVMCENTIRVKNKNLIFKLKKNVIFDYETSLIFEFMEH